MLWALLGFSVVVLALTSAFHAILRTRTAQGAMAWLVALFSMPILAIPLYWLFGRRHFAGYTQSWRAHMDELRPLARVAQGNLEAFHVPEDARHPTYTGLQALAHGQVTRGNDIELLIDGEPVAGAPDTLRRVADQPPGTPISIGVMRQDQLLTQIAIVGERPSISGNR